MSGSSKVSLMVFFQVLSPLLVIGGLIVRGLVVEDSIIPAGIKQSLNWFQENAEFSNSLSTGLFIAGGVFAVIAILFSISVAQGGHGADDERISKSLGRIR